MIDMTITPTALEVFHLEAPLVTPRRNAFGTMYARPALILRLTDASGHIGWGEVFCNWPSFGARHRKQILEDILAPAILGKTFKNPTALWQSLTDHTRLLVIQANEPGPFEQCIAGLDIAAWDLAARRADVPLHHVISPHAQAKVPVYASALTAETLDPLVPPLLDQGWTGFKVKVGFGSERDRVTVSKLREMIASNALMLDANQAWTLDTATDVMNALVDNDPLWIEEPLVATAPWGDWAELANYIPTPIAAGENLRGFERFECAAHAGGINFLQPDAVKWGGISGLIRIAGCAEQAGAKFTPHYLGSGIGLMATAHTAQALNAAWMEVDVTENPLRSALIADSMFVQNGMLSLADRPGSGLTVLPEFLNKYLVS